MRRGLRSAAGPSQAMVVDTVAPAKRRRRASNEQSAQSAPSATPQKRTKAPLPVCMRAIAADHLYSLLSDEDQALAQAGVPLEINWLKHQSRKASGSANRSPIVLTHEYMSLHHAGRYNLSADSARKVIKEWFNRWWTTGDMEDLPRGVEVGGDLEEEDWDFLLSCLVEFKWVDESGNHRRFGTLDIAQQHFLGCKGAAEQARAQRLMHLVHKAKAHTLHHLQSVVMKKFDLVVVSEVFKTPRDELKAYYCARRLLGLEPLLEYYRSTQPKPDNVHPSKIIKRLPWPTPGRPDPQPIPYYLDPCEFQLIANLDGFKIDVNVPTKALGQKVCK